MSQLGPSVRIAGVIGLLAAAGLAAVPLARVPVYGPPARAPVPRQSDEPEETPGTEHSVNGTSEPVPTDRVIILGQGLGNTQTA